MLIENQKTYKGSDAENIFFRPTFCGNSAEQLGIRVLYNMPIPTTIQIWDHLDPVLRPFESKWGGYCKNTKSQKTITMHKIKAENSFSADDYLSMVLEKITADASVNLGDLTGTELEKAETELFRQAIAEGVRATMWIGDTDGSISTLSSFNGFFHALSQMKDSISYTALTDPDAIPSALEMFKGCWDMASAQLKAIRSEGQLAFFVSSNVYNAYLDELEQKGTDSAYQNLIGGHQQLCYHGIPVVEIPLTQYNESQESFTTFCLLTDRRNLVLALNTADMPENEVRMWYNPDEMENRQRATFLVGADVIDSSLISLYYSEF